MRHLIWCLVCFVPGGSLAAPPDFAACDSAIAAVNRALKGMNRCKRDTDCAEVYGIFAGPFYIDQTSNMTRVERLRRRVNKVCPAMLGRRRPDLGPGRCRRGRCVPGRPPPAGTGHKSCWDYKVTYLEPGEARAAPLHRTLQGITPQLQVGVPRAGTLKLKVTWPAGCADCKLQLSEHNPSMGNLKQGTRTRVADGVNVTLSVRPGRYTLIATSQKDGGKPGKVSRITVELKDSRGRPMKTTHHGVSWQRMCEG